MNRLAGRALGILLAGGPHTPVTQPPAQLFSDHLFSAPSERIRADDVFALSDEMKRYLETEMRSEEHTSELQSQSNLVCRLLLEKKKKHTNDIHLIRLKTRYKKRNTSIVLTI